MVLLCVLYTAKEKTEPTSAISRSRTGLTGRLGARVAVQMLLVGGEAVVASYTPSVRGRNENIMSKSPLSFFEQELLELNRQAPAKYDAEGPLVRDPQFVFNGLKDLLDAAALKRDACERQIKKAGNSLSSAPVVLKVGKYDSFKALKDAFSPEMSALKDAELRAINALVFWQKVVNFFAEEITDRHAFLEGDIKKYQGIPA